MAHVPWLDVRANIIVAQVLGRRESTVTYRYACANIIVAQVLGRRESSSMPQLKMQIIEAERKQVWGLGL